MKYYKLEEMLQMLNDPNRDRCIRLYKDNIERFNKAQGSSHNHQAWEGGYVDHITEVMNISILLYSAYSIRKLNFSLGDALLVMFLHDLEKSWKDRVKELTDDWWGSAPIKIVNEIVREEVIKKYEIALTEQQRNALKYVEGENNDYTSVRRKMNELAAFCHIADITSARLWHDQPNENDKWSNMK
jgi:hypothetical protein